MQVKTVNAVTGLGMKRRGANRAQALVPVILVVVILTSIALAFTASANRELKASTNFASDAVQFNAARGAVNYAMEALSTTSSNGYTYGVVPPGPNTDANGWMQVGDAWVKMDVMDTGGLINLNNVSSATLQRMTVFSQNTPLPDAIVDWRTPETTATSDGAKSDYYQGLTPPYNCKDAPYDTVEELLLVKGITPEILYGTPAGTPIDADTAQSNAATASANGISASSLSRQAGPRGNGAGVTMGNGAGQTRPNGAGQTRPNGAGGNRPGDGGGGVAGGGTAAAATGDTNWDDIYAASTLPLSELLTTVSMERNIAADGTARVNINTATAAQLQNIGLTTTQANALIRARTPATGSGGGAGAVGGTGAGNAGGGANNRPGGIPGVTQGNGAGITRPPGRQAAGAVRPSPGIGSGPAAGAGSGTGMGAGSGSGAGAGAGSGGGGGTSKTFKTIADLLTVQGFTQTVMQQIADYVSVDSNQYHPNLVNINTAPAEVLATVPGMDHTTLSAILAYRQSGQAFQSMGDFYSLQGLTRQEFQNVMASLCTKSSIYRVRVKVKLPGQQSIYAVTAMVQMTDNGPQVISWQQTPRTPGWAYWNPSPVLPTPTVSTNGNSSSSSSGQ